MFIVSLAISLVSVTGEFSVAKGGVVHFTILDFALPSEEFNGPFPSYSTLLDQTLLGRVPFPTNEPCNILPTTSNKEDEMNIPVILIKQLPCYFDKLQSVIVIVQCG